MSAPESLALTHGLAAAFVVLHEALPAQSRAIARAAASAPFWSWRRSPITEP